MSIRINAYIHKYVIRLPSLSSPPDMALAPSQSIIHTHTHARTRARIHTRMHAHTHI